MSLIEDLQHLSISYQVIKVGTENFTTVLGKGGYGEVYKGILSLSGKITTVAVKRLDGNNSCGQGLKEFLTEIQLLSRCKHPNLVSLLGFCKEANERILVYEHAENGSLDKYLTMPKSTCPLTWKQRINICIDAAHGLDYLHNHFAKNQRVIHRDIKSANFLLDHNFKAMISDLGLSKLGPTNGKDTYLVTNGSGTHGYIDLADIESGIVTKKSDVYSFGVVLFEVLCGTLCYIYVNNERKFLANVAQSYYEKGKINDIIDPGLKNQMDSESLKKFAEIAYQCLLKDQKRRPSMAWVVQKLKEVLELQELEEAMGLQGLKEATVLQEIDYEVINMVSDIPRSYTTSGELSSHVSTGFIVNRGKVWFSKDGNKENQEMISATKFMHLDGRNCIATSEPESRFMIAAKILDASKLDMQVKIKPKFLSLGVTYAAYLVLKSTYDICDVLPFMLMRLKYKLNGATDAYIAYPRELKDNGWMMIELFQTISFKRNVGFKVMLEGIDFAFPTQTAVVVEGIKFLPVQKLQFDDEEVRKQEEENLLTSEIEWKNRLPSDYKHFVSNLSEEIMTTMTAPQEDVNFPTKEEAYNILYRGIHIKVKYVVDMWFWITRSNGKKCFMISPESISKSSSSKRAFQLQSGSSNLFEYVIETPPSRKVTMEFNIIYPLLSTKTTYMCYLVYKIPQNLVFEIPLSVNILSYPKESEIIYLGIPRSVVRGPKGERKFPCSVNKSQARIMYLSKPQTPVIGPDGEKRSPGSLNKLKMINFPKKRQDGWWEVGLGEFISDYEACDAMTDIISLSPNADSSIIISLTPAHGRIPNLIVQGIEFRPM